MSQLEPLIVLNNFSYKGVKFWQLNKLGTKADMNL